ncbi:hypothetical protein KGQ19_42135 [Catenulispora sp. NL8]|uniref:Uncharacterized protein n=1 Tax=Catenulispora pinistramenti TaxID=2705254 RepID=A0ABS5L558_9ACTN|nr:hypothetical protein [Catenulispora pinistramenti]MBS2553473.1 hypothetical protein [Catenulispora pinistramenti]
MSSHNGPPWLAVTASPNRFSHATRQFRSTTPCSANNAATPSRNGDEPGHVNASPTRGSPLNAGSTSSSRVAAVTLWTTSRTDCSTPEGKVFHTGASSP